MFQKILILILFLSFYSCTSQEKVNEEKKDSAVVVKSGDTLVDNNLSDQKLEQIHSGITEPEKSENKKIENKSDDKASSKIQIRTFRNTEISGYGYDIILDGKVYVHQPNIPALPGNNGFSTEEQARKVGELMIHKIENNIMPPTIDVSELDSLGIKNNDKR